MWTLYDSFGRTLATTLAAQGYFQIINVKDYGAVGDNATNDTAAIQAAINAAGAGGVTARGVDLFFPAGIYLINAALTCPFNNIMFRGAGWQSTVIMASHTTGDIIQLGDGTTHSGCGLMDMSVWCNAARTTGASINVNLMHDCLIQNFVINNCFTGILIQNASLKVRLHEGEINNIHVTDGIGISINNGLGGDTYIEGVIMSNPPASKPLAGIQITSAGHVSILKCNVTSCNYGLYVIPTGTQIVAYLFVDHSLFDSCGAAGMYLYPSGAVTAKIQSVICVNSWFSGSAVNYGVQLNLATAAILDGISFVGCRILNNYQHGVLISAGNNISFTDCTIAGNGQQTINTYDGINIAAGVSNISMVNCKIGQAGTATNQQRYAVNIAAGAGGNIQMLANDCQPNGTVGTHGYINMGVLTGGGIQLDFNTPCLSDAMDSCTVAASAGINTVETVISAALRMSASALRPGKVFRFNIRGTNTSTLAGATTFRIRMGTAGTTGDAVIMTFVLAASAASGTAVPFSINIIVVCRTAGASATFYGFLQLVNQGTTGISATATQVVVGTAATGSTITSNYLTCTCQTAAATTTNTFQIVASEVVT